MFQSNGLSLNQAPPIFTVLRFFLAGSFLGVLTGLLLTFLGQNILNINSPLILALVHIFTIGVMLSFMMGAIFQMLPVLASVIIENPIKKAGKVQFGIILGLGLLIIGFIWNSIFLLAGGVVLFFTILLISLLMLFKLAQVKTHTSSSKGIAFSIFNLIMLTIFGLIMVLMRSGVVNFELNYLDLKSIHFSFALLGWISLLIISISFQVIEMFYVTSPFPKKFANYFAIFTTLLLILKMVFFLFINNYIFNSVLNFLIIGGFLYYSILALQRVFKQKRKVVEATILFWRVGLISLFGFFMTLLVINLISVSNKIEFFLNWFLYILFINFVLSILFAMVYKIVPFLVWFHLNSKGYFTAPMMHEIISPKYAKVHFYLHLSLVFISLLTVPFPILFHILGIGLTASFGMVFTAILKASLKYKDVEKNGERFEMSMS